MEIDSETAKELEALENGRKLGKVILEANQRRIADMMKSEMGQDMKDVLSGKKQVKEPFMSRLKYKINFYIDKIFNTI